MLPEVACDRAVRGFCFNGLAIWRHQDGRHKAKRTKALRNLIGLHVAVIIFTSPDELS